MTPTRLRRITILGLAAYVLALASILLWPNGADIRRANLDIYLFGLYQLGLPPSITPETWALVFNVLLPAPIAFGMTILDPRQRARLAFVTVAGLCALAEVAQATVIPDRTPSLTDVLQNSTGALIGALLARWVTRSVAARSQTAPERVRPGA